MELAQEHDDVVTVIGDKIPLVPTLMMFVPKPSGTRTPLQLECLIPLLLSLSRPFLSSYLLI